MAKGGWAIRTQAPLGCTLIRCLQPGSQCGPPPRFAGRRGSSRSACGFENQIGRTNIQGTAAVRLLSSGPTNDGYSYREEESTRNLALAGGPRSWFPASTAPGAQTKETGPIPFSLNLPRGSKFGLSLGAP